MEQDSKQPADRRRRVVLGGLRSKTRRATPWMSGKHRVEFTMPGKTSCVLVDDKIFCVPRHDAHSDTACVVPFPTDLPTLPWTSPAVSAGFFWQCEPDLPASPPTPKPAYLYLQLEEDHDEGASPMTTRREFDPSRQEVSLTGLRLRESSKDWPARTKPQETGSGGIGQRTRRVDRRARSWRGLRRAVEAGRRNWDAHRSLPARFRSRER